MPEEQTQFIINGGVVVCKLTLADMHLRQYHFHTSGVETDLKRFKPEDRIQVCEDSCRVLWSRRNLWFKVWQLEPELFKEFVNELMSEVYVPE
jgi:hypothetical protein